MAVTIVVGAIILWIVPIFVVNALGPKGRSAAVSRGYKIRGSRLILLRIADRVRFVPSGSEAKH